MDKEKIEKYANTMIEIGTEIKDFLKKGFLDKTENELTKEEKDEYQKFIGFLFWSFGQLEEMRLNLNKTR